MLVTPVKTPIIKPGDDLLAIIRQTIPTIPEKSVLAVTSKIVAISEGRVVPLGQADKHDLVKQEAEYYTDPHSSKYNLMLTVNLNHLVVNAGIDESNANDHYVLWPADPQQAVNQIWQFLRAEYNLKEVGVILTDSRSFPLEWGVIGMSVAHCGFKELDDRRGETDLFGRKIVMVQVNVAHELASAAVFEMGEVAEQQPLCLITDVKNVAFQSRVPTAEEIQQSHIELADDLYEPLLKNAQWQRGRQKS
jgi:F420-0:gamma-glutamyl ligase